MSEIPQSVLQGVFYVVAILFTAVILALIQRRKNRFYNFIAKKHNLTLKEGSQIDLMRGFESRLFKYTRTVGTEGVLQGEYASHTFYIYTHTFYPRRFSMIRRFTVANCEFGKTTFPHILLKSKDMPLYQDKEYNDGKIFLEEEYFDTFDLYCPQNYEIEILQIFTKPLLTSIQQISERFSIEFGGNKLYIYIDKDIQKMKSAGDVEKIISILKEIIDRTDGLLLRLKGDFEALDVYFKKK